MNWRQCIVATFIVTFGFVNSECPNQCQCSDIHLQCYEGQPLYVPHNISHVGVRGIPVEDMLNFNSPSWMNVTHLSLNIEGRKNQTYSLRTLHAYEFTGLGNLEYLQIRCTSICSLETVNNTFYGLKNVKVLDLSGNKVSSLYRLIRGLHGPDTLLNLAELYLSNLVSYELPFLLPFDNLHDAMEGKPLKILDMSGTNAILKYWQTQPLLPQLEIFNISRAGIAVATLPTYKDYQSSSDVFKNLKVLDVSYPDFLSPLLQCNAVEYKEFCNYYQNHPAQFVLPHNLSELYAKNIFISTIQLRGTSNKTHVCYRDRFYAQKVQEMLEVTLCVKGNFSNLQKLVISENSITYIQPDLITPFERLNYLDVANNNLGDALSDDNYSKSFFSALRNIRILILSNNGITIIPKEVFNSLGYVRILDLSHNLLVNVAFEPQYLSVLEYLDLSFNNILNIEAGTCSTLIDKNINLQGNLFSCSCDNFCFLEYLAELNETSSCLLNDIKTVVINEVNVRKVKFTCYESIVIAVYSTLAVIAVILTSVTTCFVVKEKRKQNIIKVQERLINAGIELHEMSQNEHVVFLSYSSDDAAFVSNNVYQNLERGLKRVLKSESRCVGIGDLDMLPGQPIAEEITRCIQNSSFVVFFVSDSFSESPWCRFEVTTATYSNKPILLMMSDNVNLDEMPSILRNHYQTYTRAHWSVEQGEPIITPSWAIICENIVRLIGKGQIP